MEQLLASYGDPAYLEQMAQCVGYMPAGLVLGLIAWAVGYVVVVFVRTVRSSV